jgi:hypothetical protein
MQECWRLWRRLRRLIQQRDADGGPTDSGRFNNMHEDPADGAFDTKNEDVFQKQQLRGGHVLTSRRRTDAPL